MDFFIYFLACISILLAFGGLQAYRDTQHIGLLLSSLVSISFSVTAIVLMQWWPLLVGFILNWILRAMGLDPSYRS